MTFTEAASSVSEADESVLVCVELLAGNLEINITVVLNTSDGTAKSTIVHFQTFLSYNHYPFSILLRRYPGLYCCGQGATGVYLWLSCWTKGMHRYRSH